MAIKFNTEKSKEVLSGFLQKTSEVGKSVADSMQKSATDLSEKMKEDSYQRRLKKYSPLFASEYMSETFSLPNLVVIADSSSRRGIDVCEGAIGWRDTDGDSDALCLYQESLTLKDIEFYPSATCNAAYYVDNFDPHRYIRVDCIFAKAHDERLAELKDIAYALGAKSCSIEITEEQHEDVADSQNISLGVPKIPGFKGARSASFGTTNMRSGKITAVFEGNPIPHRPKLKWFAQDDNIKKLIDMRCKKGNSIKSEILELYGATSATMTHSVAASIDKKLEKLKISGSFSMQSKAISEHSSRMLFSVEF